jgi:hypothetical protein
VLVVGCGQAAGSSTKPGAPTLSLLSFTWTAPTPTPTLRPWRTPTSRTSFLRVTLAPTPIPLLLSIPDCYETAFSSLWCLGEVTNRFTLPVGEIVVRVYLLSSDGTILAQGDTYVPRLALHPGQRAPYGVLFNRIPAEMSGAASALVNATLVDRDTVSSLAIGQTAVAQRGELLHISGTLTNTTPQSITHVSILITLYDRRGRVTGFRQIRPVITVPLSPNGALPFTADLVPLGRGPQRFEVVAEAMMNS